MALYVTKSATGMVTEALTGIGKADEETPIAASMLEGGARLLGILLKDIQAEGATLWMRRRLTVDLLEDEKDYILSDNSIDALDVSQATVADDEDGTNELPATMISRSDYMDFPNKTSTGKPVWIWFHSEEADGPTVTVWPVPDQDYTLFLDHREPFSHITNAADIIDIPDYWMGAVIYNLEVRCAMKWGTTGTSRYAEIKLLAKDLYDTAAAMDIVMDGGGEIRFAPGP
jgi:hypothetical protein